MTLKWRKGKRTTGWCRDIYTWKRPIRIERFGWSFRDKNQNFVFCLAHLTKMTLTQSVDQRAARLFHRLIRQSPRSHRVGTRKYICKAEGIPDHIIFRGLPNFICQQIHETKLAYKNNPLPHSCLKSQNVVTCAFSRVLRSPAYRTDVWPEPWLERFKISYLCNDWNDSIIQTGRKKKGWSETVIVDNATKSTAHSATMTAGRVVAGNGDIEIWQFSSLGWNSWPQGWLVSCKEHMWE